MSIFLLMVALIVLGVLVTGIVASKLSPFVVLKAGVDAIKSGIRWTP